VKIAFVRGKSKLFSGTDAFRRSARQDKLFERKARVFVLAAERGVHGRKKVLKPPKNNFQELL
jgi:hypothetical protein